MLIIQCRPFIYGSQFLRVDGYPTGDNMPEVPYFLLMELTLFRFELQAGFSELLKHFPQVEQVILESAANDEHVIQVHET
jgi:hypothetical protein